MKNDLTFRPNISNLKKFWIRKEIKENRIIESGSFNEKLYLDYLESISYQPQNNVPKRIKTV